MFSGSIDDLEGVSYVSGDETGVTGLDGSFLYEMGSPVTFSIGDIVLGQADGMDVQDISSLTDSVEVETNLDLFLDLIDDDDNSDNGILITELVRDMAVDQNVNFNQSPEDFIDDSNVQRVVSILSSVTSAGERSIKEDDDTSEPPLVGERSIDVETVEELRAALINARPGDQIMLAPGVYQPSSAESVRFAGSNRRIYFGTHSDGNPISGEPDNPIILESADPNQPAVLRGLENNRSGYVLWIYGEHWVVRNLILENGGKGLMMDNASGSVVRDVEIRRTGDEALHLRSGTSNVLIENVTIDTAGLNQPGFGEGVYVGSDRNQWDQYDRACNNNVIRNCTIRAVTAEAFDIKEGTEGTIVEGCSIYGGSISNELFADSFIDIKGTSARIFSNRFYKENNDRVTKGVALVDRNNSQVMVSSSFNWIYDNVFNMDNADGVMVHGFKGLDNFAWDNRRIPDGDEYNGNAPELYFRDPR